MSTLDTSSASLRDEHGFTMIELLVAMSMGTVVCFAAFLLLKFTAADVSRITERVHVDQTGSVVLERIMLELHSTCVTPDVTPIQAGSTENVIKFISEGGKQSAFEKVYLHEIFYTPAEGAKEGTLTEQSYQSIPPPAGKAAPEYTFSKAPTTKVLLLTGVKKSETKEGKAIPIFQYFRYYRKSDPSPVYGQLNTSPMTATELAKEEEAEEVAKVTVAFTLAPTGKETATFNHDRPIPLEDSAVFRLATSSEAPTNPNQPCTPET
jgi:prepilin-type N-terminal cleavage/methylation domain-containing protein